MEMDAGTRMNARVRTESRQEMPAGTAVGGTECPHCRAVVPENAEFCPVCGMRLADSYCTFCGSPMDHGQSVCDECGMPVSGVVCPECGTLNQRPFCRKCNSPLNRAAVRAVEKAKADPKFQEACEMARKAAELEEKMASGNALSEGERRMMELVGESEECADTQKLCEEYSQVVKDLDRLLEEMLPPPGSTPQEQRNYYSARRIAVTSTVRTKEVVKEPVEWVCNYCGCHHSKPSECVSPELGGKWIYRTREIVTTVTNTDYRYEE